MGDWKLLVLPFSTVVESYGKRLRALGSLLLVYCARDMSRDSFPLVLCSRGVLRDDLSLLYCTALEMSLASKPVTLYL